MEESSLQPWHLFTFFFLAFQAVVIYLRHILLTTIAAVAFGAITEVTSRYLQLAHLSPPASFPATSLSCSGVGGSGSPLSWLSSSTALGYFQSNLDIKKLQQKFKCVGKWKQNLQLVFLNLEAPAFLGHFKVLVLSPFYDSGISLSGADQMERPARL